MVYTGLSEQNYYKWCIVIVEEFIAYKTMQQHCIESYYIILLAAILALVNIVSSR